MEVEFTIFTDFHQFTVSDSTADFEDLWEKWTDETIEAMFVQGDGYGIEGNDRYVITLSRLDEGPSVT